MARRRRVASVRPDQCFKGRQFTAEVILWAVRWYLMFPISLCGRPEGATLSHPSRANDTDALTWGNHVTTTDCPCQTHPMRIVLDRVRTWTAGDAHTELRRRHQCGSRGRALQSSPAAA